MSDREKLLEDVIEQVIISHTWMMKDIKHRADETKDGDCSPNVTHAMSVQETLEKL